MNAFSYNQLRDARLSGQVDFRLHSQTDERLIGAYFTQARICDFMTMWGLTASRQKILEPSFGGGDFLRSILRTCSLKLFSGVSTFGCELSKSTFDHALDQGLLDPKSAVHGDFLGTSFREIDAVIGNPPYVRIRNLCDSEKERAVLTCRESDFDLDPSSSLWLPFTIHATRSLASGGRLAFVLPFEATYVKYARKFWQFLATRFGSVTVCRVKQRLFPDIMQEVVLLFADSYGSKCNSIVFKCYDTILDLEEEKPSVCEALQVQSILAGERVFQIALLPRELRENLLPTLLPRMDSVGDVCSFNVGYVTGDKDFFHPQDELIRKFEIPPDHLVDAVSSGKQLLGMGIETELRSDCLKKLYLPALGSLGLTPGDEKYIAFGEEIGVHRRYKCRIRKPWYILPNMRVPDLLLTVFADSPILASNSAHLLASNSLLCGFLKKGTRAQFVSGWYTDLTILQMELEVHALGGGVMVAIPGEVGKLRVPNDVPLEHLPRVDAYLRTKNVRRAYSEGTKPILQDHLGLSSSQVGQIQEGIAILRSWRKALSTSREL